MATRKIRYYVTRPGAAGARRRFWSPTANLLEAGWEMERLPDDEAAAIRRAEQLNDMLDAWRRGERQAGNHAPDPATLTAAAAPSLAIGSNGGPPMIAPPPQQPARLRGFTRGTVGWVIADWKKTPKWTAEAGSSIKPFAESTRRNYTWAAALVQEWADDGHLQVRRITPARVQKLYEAFLEVNHSKANAVVTVLRIILEHARKRDLVDSNAAERPGLIALPPRLRVASHAEQACLIAHADALGLFSMGDAIMLGHDLGQREGDIIALTRLRYRSGRFFLKPRKTAHSSGVLIDVPASPRLAQRMATAIARIDALSAAAAQQAQLLGRAAPAVPPQLVVYEGTLEKYGEHHFRHVYARVRAAAAGQRFAISRNPGKVLWNDDDLARTRQLPKCTSLAGSPAQGDEPEILPCNFQDLRDTFITNAAEGGATIPQICAVSGHTEKSAYNILKHYLALNAAMAAEGVRLAVELYDQRETARQAQQTDSEGQG